MTTSPRDRDGQPIVPFYANALNNSAKALDELVGICLGILADKRVNEEEARAFASWVEQFARVALGWPFDDLLRRVRRIFADGIAAKEECDELGAIMREITGSQPHEVVELGTSTRLPLDQPPPPLLFRGHEFVVTGRFAFGTRTAVHEAISTRGGMIGEHPTLDTAFLVIGTFASRDWIHTAYGRKIERAMELRTRKSGIAIVHEEHWRKFV